MHFLPDVYVTCDVCHGHRYNRETLEVKFKGKSIADVLDMTVEDAAEFFKAVPGIRDKMRMLQEVGLGYVKVGQQATTLSGGEAQRVKLSKELSRRATGQTLYILDEPTTGLHFEDVRKLLEVLHRLVEQGNTVVVIEHNLDVIKTADWVIDLGPGGGVNGGRIVVEGTPEVGGGERGQLHGAVSAAVAGAGEREAGGGGDQTAPFVPSEVEGRGSGGPYCSEVARDETVSKKRRKRGKIPSYPILHGHVRDKKKLIPPILGLSETTFVSTIDTIFPEVVWIGVLLDWHGLRDGIEIVSTTLQKLWKAQENVNWYRFSEIAAHDDELVDILNEDEMAEIKVAFAAFRETYRWSGLDWAEFA